MQLKVKRLDPKARIPTVAHPGEDLAYDLYALSCSVLHPNKPTLIRTGIAACFDDDSAGRIGLLIRDRSSLAANGIIVSGGVIDSGYRGEIVVIMTLVNAEHEDDFYQFAPGSKIAQMIPIQVMTSAPVVEVSELEHSMRSTGGFGSTGA